MDIATSVDILGILTDRASGRQVGIFRVGKNIFVGKFTDVLTDAHQRRHYIVAGKDISIDKS